MPRHPLKEEVALTNYEGAHAVVLFGLNADGTFSPNGGDSSGASTSTTPATFIQGGKVVVTAGTPVRLVAATLLVESVEIVAQKDVVTPNTGNIFVGFADDQQTRTLIPGDVWVLTAPAGKKIDLHEIWVDSAVSADAVGYTAIN